MTRAIQIDLLLAGIVDPTSGEPVASGSVEFYAADTSTPKSVWTEKEKTNAFTSYDLSGIGTPDGSAILYAEGNYKIVIKDSDGSTVETLNNMRFEFPFYGIRTVTAGTVDMLSQDDFIRCNTTSGDVTISFLPSAQWTRPLKVRRISGANNIILAPDGSETIDALSSLTVTSDAIVEIISDGNNLETAGFRSSFSDADNDTKIQVEESADDDTIRFDTAGTQRVTIDANGLHGAVADADGDTKIQLEEGADDDTIRFDAAGSEIVTIDANGLHGVVADADGDTKIQVEESADEDKIRIDTGGTERVVVDSAGMDVVSGDFQRGGISGYNPEYANESLSGVSSVTITGLESGKVYEITMELWSASGTTPQLYMRFGNSGGIDTGGNYGYSSLEGASSNIDTAETSTAGRLQTLTYLNGSLSLMLKARIMIDPNDNTRAKVSLSGAISWQYYIGAVSYGGASAVDRVQFYPDNGTISGRIRSSRIN